MRSLILVLALVAVPASACDWEVSRKPDAMSDKVTCYVTSPSAHITFYRYGTDRPNVVTDSAYSRSGLMIRVDDNEAIRMGDNAYDRGKALDALLPQLNAGKRIRVRYLDYPHTQEGDAEICNLPALLESCTQ